MTAFLLTWKESGWPHENIVRMVERQRADGYVEEPWRIKAHTKAGPGDRVWALRQGRGPKGIFGAGRITGVPALGPAGNGETRMIAPVRFDAFVDPKQRLLIDEQAVAAILHPRQIRAQASGYLMDDQQSAALDELLATSPPVELGGSGDWTDAELRAIVADYFSMLDDELAGRPYSKTQHRNVLQATIHRSRGSIERKHQNISAILRDLRLPWIDGYKPLGHLQDALVDAVEARLSRSELDRLDEAPLPVKPPISVSIFVPPPPPSIGPTGKPGGSVSSRYDPARDAANRVLGRAGEDFVVEIEQKRLEELGRNDLAKQVKWVSKEVGDSLGYDITSFTEEGTPMFIEVKTTRGSITTPFFISENERRVAAEKGPAFRVYRLFGFGTDPKIYSLPGPLERALALEPIAYRARVRGGPC
jgi:hypothetical protein